MHFPLKMRENCRMNIFGDKQTIDKVWLRFLEVKVLTEM